MNPALRQALSPMRRPCGSLRLTVMSETCVLRCSGALWLPDHSALIAGDLHLEKGSAFAARWNRRKSPPACPAGCWTA